MAPNTAWRKAHGNPRDNAFTKDSQGQSSKNSCYKNLQSYAIKLMLQYTLKKAHATETQHILDVEDLEFTGSTAMGYLHDP